MSIYGHQDPTMSSNQTADSDGDPLSFTENCGSNSVNINETPEQRVGFSLLIGDNLKNSIKNLVNIAATKLSSDHVNPEDVHIPDVGDKGDAPDKTATSEGDLPPLENGIASQDGHSSDLEDDSIALAIDEFLDDTKISDNTVNGHQSVYNVEAEVHTMSSMSNAYCSAEENKTIPVNNVADNEIESRNVRIEKDNVPSESVNDRPEGNNIETESCNVQTESDNVQTESGNLPTECDNVSSERVNFQAENDDNFLIESGSLQTECATVPVESKTDQSGINNIGTESDDIRTESDNIQTGSNKFLTEYDNIETESHNIQTESGKIHIESNNTKHKDIAQTESDNIEISKNVQTDGSACVPNESGDKHNNDTKKCDDSVDLDTESFVSCTDDGGITEKSTSSNSSALQQSFVNDDGWVEIDSTFVKDDVTNNDLYTDCEDVDADSNVKEGDDMDFKMENETMGSDVGENENWGSEGVQNETPDKLSNATVESVDHSGINNDIEDGEDKMEIEKVAKSKENEIEHGNVTENNEQVESVGVNDCENDMEIKTESVVLITEQSCSQTVEQAGLTDKHASSENSCDIDSGENMLCAIFDVKSIAQTESQDNMASGTTDESIQPVNSASKIDVSDNMVVEKAPVLSEEKMADLEMSEREDVKSSDEDKLVMDIACDVSMESLDDDQNMLDDDFSVKNMCDNIEEELNDCSVDDNRVDNDGNNSLNDDNDNCDDIATEDHIKESPSHEKSTNMDVDIEITDDNLEDSRVVTNDAHEIAQGNDKIIQDIANYMVEKCGQVIEGLNINSSLVKLENVESLSNIVVDNTQSEVCAKIPEKCSQVKEGSNENRDNSSDKKVDNELCLDAEIEESLCDTESQTILPKTEENCDSEVRLKSNSDSLPLKRKHDSEISNDENLDNKTDVKLDDNSITTKKPKLYLKSDFIVIDNSSNSTDNDDLAIKCDEFHTKEETDCKTSESKFIDSDISDKKLSDSKASDNKLDSMATVKKLLDSSRDINKLNANKLRLASLLNRLEERVGPKADESETDSGKDFDIAGKNHVRKEDIQKKSQHIANIHNIVEQRKSGILDGKKKNKKRGRFKGSKNSSPNKKACINDNKVTSNVLQPVINNISSIPNDLVNNSHPQKTNLEKTADTSTPAVDNKSMKSVGICTPGLTIVTEKELIDMMKDKLTHVLRPQCRILVDTFQKKMKSLEISLQMEKKNSDKLKREILELKRGLAVKEQTEHQVKMKAQKEKADALLNRRTVSTQTIKIEPPGAPRTILVPTSQMTTIGPTQVVTSFPNTRLRQTIVSPANTPIVPAVRMPQTIIMQNSTVKNILQATRSTPHPPSNPAAIAYNLPTHTSTVVPHNPVFISKHVVGTEQKNLRIIDLTSDENSKYKSNNRIIIAPLSNNATITTSSNQNIPRVYIRGNVNNQIVSMLQSAKPSSGAPIMVQSKAKTTVKTVSSNGPPSSQALREQAKPVTLVLNNSPVKHPSPLPVLPLQLDIIDGKIVPSKPTLNIARANNGIVLSWSLSIQDNQAEISTYTIYAYQETTQPPNKTLWKKVGAVKAMPLPMACTLTQFQEGHKYHFSVQAVDIHGRLGPYSDPSTITLLAEV